MIKSTIERKNTAEPLLNIFDKNTTIRAKVIMGKRVTKYEITILNIPINENEEKLHISPTIVDKIITAIRFTRTKKAIAVTLAENSLNLDTGLVRVIFMVLCENSPENKSIATSAVNSGSKVFDNTNRTDMGKTVLSLKTPTPTLLTPTDISFPMAMTAIEITKITVSFFLLYIFSISLMSDALNPSIFVDLAYKVIFKGSVICQNVLHIINI